MKFILILILLISSNVFAQKELRLNSNAIKEEEIGATTGLDQDFEGKEKGYTKEWGYSYLKLGEGILSTMDKKYNGSSFGIGHRQYAEEFVYGLEFNSMKNGNKFDLQTIVGSLGFHKQWKHRLQPYALVQIGSSKLKLKDDIKEKASGYYTGLDLGMTLSKFVPFHFLAGMRWGVHNYSDKIIQKASSQELYILMGFEF